MDISDDCRILVFVPSYNDFEALAGICHGIDALPGNYSILLLDDGSDSQLDGSLFGDNVLKYSLPANFGLGTCTHIAFDHMLRHGYDIVVRVDGDGQHPIHEIPNLVKLALDLDVDFVVGGRCNQGLRPGLTGRLAVAIKWYYSLVAKWLTNMKAPNDVNSGFFCATHKATAIINRYPLERFSEPQMYIVACRSGLSVRELIIEQQPRRAGKSTLGLGQAVRMFYRFNVFILSEVLQRPHRQ